MPLQFTTIEEPSFSRGIDARSAENQIRDGFVRDLVNADIVEGRVKKRKGYAPFAGNIPLRVTRYYQNATNKAIVSLDSSIDLSRVESRPILIYGKTSTEAVSANDPFSNDTNHSCWFTKWETNLRKIFLKGGLPEKSITATPAEHSIPSQSMYVGVSENIPNPTNTTDVLTGDLLTTSVTVKADRTIQVDYVNSRTTDVPVFLYYLDRTPVAGTTFTSDVLTGFLSYEIFAATHGLSTSNIMYQLYQVEDITGNWIQCKPDAFYAKEDGSVKVVVSSSTNKYKLVLSSVPDSQTDEGGDGFTLTNQANSYLFYTCYETLTSGIEFAAGYTRSAVEPDTVQYDDTDKATTFSFDPASAVSNIRFVYEYGIIRTNEIYLSSAAPSSDIGASTRAPTSPAFSAMASADTAPQMTLYGIGHDVAYGDQKRQYRRGWVNHVDSYRSPSTAHIVAGLGGNLYAEREQELAPTNFVMPTYYPELFARVSAKTILGPAFSGSNNDRTRGVYSFTGGGDGLAEVTKVAYNAVSNKVVYTLNVPSFSVTPATTPIDANDFLTVDGMSYKRHNGTFQISAPPTVVDANTITISVSNPDVDSTDYDDANTSGYAGVFTDRFTATANSPFLVGDRLLSSSWDESTTLTISSVNEASPTVAYLSGCIKRLELGTNLAVTGQRTSATIPLRTVSRGVGNESVNYLIPGDTVSVSGVADPLQILSVDATNKTITLDRSITWADTISLPTTISVAARWLPVEAPTSSTDGALIPKTSVRYFTSGDYDNQAFLRSAMVQNNLYLTNGNDEVYKYDGENNYRAGIIPWQPGLFLSIENLSSGGIPLVPYTTLGTISLEGGKLKTTSADAAKFSNGDNVVLISGSNKYNAVIADIDTDTTAGSAYIGFTENLTATTLAVGAKLVGAYLARYSFRLNIKDVNGVTTASAVTGAEDFVVEVAPETVSPKVINLRLVGMPAWDQYDYRNQNIELQIYRTLWTKGSVGEVPKFYRIATKGLTFAGNDAYVDIVDTYSNDSLSQEDSVVSVLSPSIVPAGWDEPPRAKYTTTAGNRLVLANLTDWPTLTMQFLSEGNPAAGNFANGRIVFTVPNTTTAAVGAVYAVGGLQYTVAESLTLGQTSLSCTGPALPSPTTGTLTKVSGTGTASIAFTAAIMIGQKFTFYRDYSNAASDKIAYELRQASSSLACIPCACTTTGEFKVVIPSITSTTGYEAGQWLYLYHSTVTNGSRSTFTTVAGSQYLFPTLPIVSIANDTIIHFETNGTLPTGLTTTQGYYVKGQLSLTTTVKNQATTATTLNLNGGTTFPTQGVITVSGNQYSYTGITIAGTDATLTGISPAISVASGVTVSINGFSVTDSYQGTALTFSAAGSGTQNVLWDGSELDYAGWWKVDSVDLVPTVNYLRLTVKSATSSQTGIPKQFPDRILFATDKNDVPVLVDVDGNMGMFNGNGPVPYLNITRRLGMAINASMRVAETATNKAWLVARSESDVGGQLIVRQPRVEDTIPGLKVENNGSGYSTYVNGSLAPATIVPASVTRYPSRLAVSYDNYPEIFDSLWVVDTDSSDSVIDVNSADGQEITGVIPFFGESAFGASQKAGVLVVFKQNSIYLVNVAAKVAGQEAVQRLETQGLGCTAPYSIAPTKNGIMFANESGIYALRTDQRIEYLGRFMERNWQEKVDLGALAIAQGHHYGVGRQYKLSVPMVAESSSTYAENSQVYVYNHTAEADGELGGWTRYTNHPVTGWANLFQDAFLATANGSVMKVRNLGGVTDYRDQNSPIESILAARANAFGNTGIRKAVANLVVHYRSGANSEYTKVYTSPDLFDVYQESELFKVVTKSVQDGLSTLSGQAIVSIMHTFPRRRCIYMSVTITNNGIDDNVEIAGMSYIVAGLSSSGIKQAAETTD